MKKNGLDDGLGDLEVEALTCTLELRRGQKAILQLADQWAPKQQQ